jgi:murein DD-endopeptidase
MRIAHFVGTFLLISCFAADLPAEPLVESIDMRVSVKPAPLAIEGHDNLVYELHITNFTSAETVLRRIEVLDDTGRLLTSLSGEALARSIDLPGAQSTSLTLDPGRFAVVYFWITLPESQTSPDSLQHRVTLRARSDAGFVETIVDASAVPVGSVESTPLQAPLGAGKWVAAYDPDLARGHRRVFYALDGRARLPHRYALDLFRINDDGNLVNGDRSELTNWHGYGAEVLAVANGTVADTRDGLPDRLIGPSMQRLSLHEHSGNHIVLDIGDGRFAVYEHLQPGSLTVKTGDSVVAGQVIGRVGNSGSSPFGPHLHFHVADANGILNAESLPYVFEGFAVEAAYESVATFAAGEQPVAAPEPVVRQHEFPARNAVLRFDIRY